MIKDHEKFIIVSYCDLKIVSVILMNYQESSSYAQHMMNMIFKFHKFFIYCYIDDIVIFSKILKNHFKHLNIVFNLFDELKIILKKVKTYLNYLLIILLNQWVDDFDMISSKKWIAALQDLFIYLFIYISNTEVTRVVMQIFCLIYMMRKVSWHKNSHSDMLVSHCWFSCSL